MNRYLPKASGSLASLTGAFCVALSLSAFAQDTNEVLELVAGDAASGDLFGYSVSIDGNTAVIGARSDDDEDNGFTDSGSAYVFTYEGTTWQQQKLTAIDAAASDLFGVSVSIDGDTAVIGAFGKDDNGSNSGSAYVFSYNGTAWMGQAKLTASDAAAGDLFGISVSVSGNTVVVGASGDDSNKGSAYVFTRSGTTWQEQKLTASDAAADDRFGGSVSIDGDTAVIGATDDDDGGLSSGSAYVFTRTGTSWVQQEKLTASDAAAGDLFGGSVSVDADTAVIGARGDDDGGGSAYVFTYNGTDWTPEGDKLTASDAADLDLFGSSVSIDEDTAVIGSPGNDLHGSAYVFTRAGTSWVQQEKLTASDAAAGDLFGGSVSVDADTAFVGANGDDDVGVNSNSGSAYVFSVQTNEPPVADAGPDRSIRAGEIVLLDGSSSSDDNTATGDLEYFWSFDLLPAAVLDDATSQTPSFIADVAGTFSISLVVTDDAGLPSDPDFVQIGTNNLAPTADAGDDRLIVIGDTVLLDGFGSSDPEVDTLTYQWSVEIAPAGSAAALTDPAAATTSFTPDLEGDYVVELEVSDFLGPGAPDSVEITVTNAGTFAELKIVEAADTVTSLDDSQFTDPKKRKKFIKELSKATKYLQKDKPDKAVKKLEKAIKRTDGCPLRGAPDPKGGDRDWISDCAAQQLLYDCLTAARDALVQ